MSGIGRSHGLLPLNLFSTPFAGVYHEALTSARRPTLRDQRLGDPPRCPILPVSGAWYSSTARDGSGHRERCWRSFRACSLKEGYVIHLLPIVIMAESLVAAIVYATQCKWWPALYWCAAGLLNLAVIMITKSGR